MKNPITSIVTAGLTVALLSGVLAASGAAQVSRQRQRSFEFSVIGGVGLVGNGDYATPVAGSSQETSRTVGLRYAKGYLVGARLTENRWRHIGASLGYTFANRPVTFTGLSDQIPSLGISHSVHHFAYDMIYYPLDPYNRLRPYAFAGPGLSFFRLGSKTVQGLKLNNPWKAGFDWGGGVKYLLHDKAAVGVELRDAITGVPGYGFPTSAQADGAQFVPGFRPHGHMQNVFLSVGFIYQWDNR